MGAVTFYVCAHQDDWQLFRGEQAHVDMNLDDVGVAIICVTAGELGGPWEARERGCVASCQMAIDGTSDSTPATLVSTINGHLISSVRYKRSVCYFLRIPEAGNAVGGSLERLRNENKAATTVDGLNTYASWQDLTETLKAIMEIERQTWNEPNPWINAPDCEQPFGGPDDDNPDHILVGFAVRDADLAEYNKLYFLGYRPPPPWQQPGDPIPESTDGPLSAEQIEHKRSLFMAYVNVDPALQDDYERHKDVYESWLTRTYFRVE